MASLAGRTWQFIPTTYGAFLTFNATFNKDGAVNAVISPSPFAPGPVVYLNGTWTEGPRCKSFTFQMSNSIGDVCGCGTHQDKNGQGALTIVIDGGGTSPNLGFQMMDVTG
jgi:hypothetical protein